MLILLCASAYVVIVIAVIAWLLVEIKLDRKWRKSLERDRPHVPANRWPPQGDV